MSRPPKKNQPQPQPPQEAPAQREEEPLEDEDAALDVVDLGGLVEEVVEEFDEDDFDDEFDDDFDPQLDEELERDLSDFCEDLEGIPAIEDLSDDDDESGLPEFESEDDAGY